MPSKIAKKLSAGKAGKSITDFRAAHDKNFIIPERIRAALAEMGDGWEYEGDFLKLTKLSTTELSSYRHQFEEHIVIVSGKNSKRVWCGTTKLARELREMV